MDHIPSTHLDQGKYAFIYTQQENSLQKKQSLSWESLSQKKTKSQSVFVFDFGNFKKDKTTLGPDS